MPDKTPKSHRRPRPSLMWRLREWFDRRLGRVGKSLGNLAETFEWAMHRGAQLLMPWTWFRKRAEEREFPREQQPNVTESFEFYFHRAFSLLGTLFMPWTWFRKRNRTEEAAEQITGERTTSVAERAEWILGTFFEKCEDVARLIGQILLPRQVVKSTENVQHAIARTTAKTSHKLQRRFQGVAEKLLPRRIFWPLYWISRQLWYAFDFISEWWWSREYQRLTWAVPAILMLMPLSASLVAGLWNTDSKKIQHYNASLQKARQTESVDRTNLLKRKLEQLGFRRVDRADFFAAIELAKQDRIEEAYEKIGQLAPLDSPGLFEAHLWMAAQMMEGTIKPSAEEKRSVGSKDPWRVLARHVEHALSLEPKNELARRFRAEVLLHDEQWVDAIKQLEELKDVYPDFHATLAHTYHMMGDIENARLNARRAISHYRLTLARANADGDGERQTTLKPSVPEQDERPLNSETAVHLAAEKSTGPSGAQSSAPPNSGAESTDSLHEGEVEGRTLQATSLLSRLGFLRIAEAYRLLDEYDEEIEMLGGGVEMFPDDKKLRRIFESARRRQLHRLRYTDPRMQQMMESLCLEDRNNQDVIRVLVRGILAKESPNEIASIGLDVSAFQNRDRTKVFEAASKIHQYLRSKNLVSPEVYLRLGNFYLVQGDYPRAARFFQETCEADPTYGPAWNNLAWIWSQGEKPELSKALSAVNRAIEIEADPRFIETRAQIYMKQNNFEQAARDLETAIAGAIPDVLAAHRSLVQCYETLGLNEQAAAHRRIVESTKR